MRKLFTIILVILLVSCTKDNNVGRGKSINSINEELKKEAKSIFQSKLTNERSFRSYWSSDVTYRIKAKNFG